MILVHSNPFLSGISISFHIVPHRLMQGAGSQSADVSCGSVSGDQIAQSFFWFPLVIQKALAEAQESHHQKEKRNEQTLDFISEIETMPDSITEFRTDYWGHLVEKITVYRKGTMTFAFACGVEVQI